MLFLVFAFFSRFGKFIFEEKSLDVIFSCCKNANCGCHLQERKYLFEEKRKRFGLTWSASPVFLLTSRLPDSSSHLLPTSMTGIPSIVPLTWTSAIRGWEPLSQLAPWVQKGSQTSDLFSTSLPQFDGILVSETSSNNCRLLNPASLFIWWTKR